MSSNERDAATRLHTPQAEAKEADERKLPECFTEHTFNGKPGALGSGLNVYVAGELQMLKVQATKYCSPVAASDLVKAIEWVARRNGIQVPEWAQSSEELERLHSENRALAAALELLVRLGRIERERFAPRNNLEDEIMTARAAEPLPVKSPWPLRFKTPSKTMYMKLCENGLCGIDDDDYKTFPLNKWIIDTQELALAAARAADADPQYRAWRTQETTTCEEVVRAMIGGDL